MTMLIRAPKMAKRKRRIVPKHVVDISLIDRVTQWAHTLARSDAWVLCGPDTASTRYGVCVGLRDRLVSLENLLHDVGYRRANALRINYKSGWLAKTLTEPVMLERSNRP
jgi:hypothetical protein